MTAGLPTPENLEPCPFCGGAELQLCDNTGPKLCTNAHAFVRCRGCHTDGPEGDTAELAVRYWNSRTDPSPALGDVRVHSDGSLTLGNASVQRLLDYGVLHYTNAGWVVSNWPANNHGASLSSTDGEPT
jgi:Lar family restriction alleviation protein